MTLMVLSACSVLLPSCNDIVTYKTDLEDRFSNDGAPSIAKVYDIRDVDKSNELAGGSLAQIIHIVGKNLSNPTSITFNGIEANLKDCYCENKDSYVVIPRVLPENVTNRLVYTTDKGTCELDFEVSIPTLDLEGLANEYASAGSSVKVNGDFFDLFGFGADGSDASVTIDGAPVQIDSVSEAYMSIVIPEGTPDNSEITFSWTDPSLGAQTRIIPFRNTRYLFFKDFETAGFWSESLKEKYLTDGSREGDPVSLGYRFFRFKDSFAGWTWNSIGLGDGWNYDTPSDWAENWVLKFEIWTNPSYPIPAFVGNSGIFIQINLGDNVLTDPAGGSSFNTGGEWRTVSFPLGQYGLGKGFPNNGDYWGFAFTIQPPVDWTVDFAVANFRIEPVNY